MKESEFHEIFDATLSAIEECLDEQADEVDYEVSAGIMTITCPNGSVIILNRQSANFQLWVAAKSGGFHLDYVDGQWRLNNSGQPLSQLLEQLIREQSAEQIDFSGIC